VTHALLRRIEALKTVNSERNSTVFLSFDSFYRPKSSAIDARTVDADEKFSDRDEQSSKYRTKSSGVGVLNPKCRPKSFGVAAQNLVRRASMETHREKSASFEPQS